MKKFLSFTVALSLLISCFSFNVFAASIDLTRVVGFKDGNVLINTTIEDAVPNQNVTVLTCEKYVDPFTDEQIIVYIDQVVAIVNDDGTFNLSFNIGDYTPNKWYSVRVGGTDIDTADILDFKILDDSLGEMPFYGDVNIDGAIDAEDSDLVFQYVLKKGESNFSEEQIERSKVTGNDEVTAQDAAAIYQKFINPDFDFTPKSN